MHNHTDAKPAAFALKEKKAVSAREEKLAGALKRNLARRKKAARRSSCAGSTPKNG